MLRLCVEYQQFDLSGYSTASPVQKDQRLNFSFTLAGIGTFANSSAPWAAARARAILTAAKREALDVTP